MALRHPHVIMSTYVDLCDNDRVTILFNTISYTIDNDKTYYIY